MIANFVPAARGLSGTLMFDDFADPGSGRCLIFPISPLTGAIAFGLMRVRILAGSTVVGYPSGQRGQTVNLLAYAFTGSNPVPTTIFCPFRAFLFERVEFSQSFPADSPPQ